MDTLHTVRLNITIPKDTAEKLKKSVRNRTTSRFITEAVEEKMAREQWELAFAEYLKLPPTLTHIKDPVQWVDDLRAEEEERLKRLGL